MRYNHLYVCLYYEHAFEHNRSSINEIPESYRIIQLLISIHTHSHIFQKQKHDFTQEYELDEHWIYEYISVQAFLGFHAIILEN